MLPKSIGRYKIIDRVGSGGMAVVYLGQDEVFERPVAVKVLPTHLGQDPDNRERFRREAKAIASLEHAAVVPVYDYGEDGDQLFLIMRHMQGGSLKDRLSHGRMALADAAVIIGRLSSALDKAHAMGMIHRDLKPGNILFDLEDNPYITDFGLVKLVESSVQLTHSEFFGTPAYTSPEQIQGDKNIDGRADVYSLTAMFFHMVTGAPPYEAGSAMALLMKHVSDPIPRLADSAPDLPPGLQNVIDRGMAKMPADRFRTAGELSKAIAKLADAPAGIAAPASTWGRSASEAVPSATEAAPAVSFDALRRRQQPPATGGEDTATRRDSFSPGVPPSAPPPAGAPSFDATDPEATHALDYRAIPTERRRLEWKPQADTSPPPAAPDAVSASSPLDTAKPSTSGYTQPPKPLEKKASGIPVLIFIVVILVISLLYFAFQKGLF